MPLVPIAIFSIVTILWKKAANKKTVAAAVEAVYCSFNSIKYHNNKNV